MKIYSLIILILPAFLFAQDPDVGANLFYSDLDGSGTPFSRNETVCFDLQLGSAAGNLVFPPPSNPGSPFLANITTANLIDRTVEFIISEDIFLDEDFFTVTIPTDGSPINFTQNSTIPESNYSIYKICGVVSETVVDGGTIAYVANGVPGGYVSTNEGTDGVSNTATVQGILPIELLRFEAIPGKNDVNLEWETATEINNSHFEIQRSADGRSYETIGTVGGHGNTSRVISYEYTDGSPLSGRSYYRLKQVDLDGAFEYSPVEEVTFGGNGELKIFPNPAASGTEINIRGSKIRSVRVYNMVGQLLINETYDRPVNQVTLRSSKLPQGMYITKINETTEKRLMIK